ncbi:GDSL-like Lipase/Acylhydrolase [Pirellulimonas nuda]|uniref:GDSL-like Lipase/Acylhydrolase n=1 Tax=Pirellulimonas nuda TaxID=2528009 RepID=A0A518D5J3_9BACT|nr:SGNH/GDSL hydrolase family protein [Pirellulimonas nuda]QDU86734.1 GDSL-like Lipase/Acylhydrolase [Pirellulimonas nuda]
MNTRREFLRDAALVSGAVATGACFAKPAEGDQTKSLLAPGAVVLFEGDSITDAGRNKKSDAPNDPDGMGRGYASLAAKGLHAEHPGWDLKCYNRGVSGNKVFQIAERWDGYCQQLKPDLISILIGVNDFWHKLNGKYDGTIETYRTDYRALLERTKRELPGTKLVLCEPFVLKVGAVDDRWFPDFPQYRNAAKALADEYADAWVPFQEALDKACESKPPQRWAHDGVHPTPAGAQVMADAWLKAVG